MAPAVSTCGPSGLHGPTADSILCASRALAKASSPQTTTSSSLRLLTTASASVRTAPADTAPDPSRAQIASWMVSTGAVVGVIQPILAFVAKIRDKIEEGHK